MNYRDYNDFELLSYVSENNEEASEVLFDRSTFISMAIAKSNWENVAIIKYLLISNFPLL